MLRSIVRNLSLPAVFALMMIMPASAQTAPVKLFAAGSLHGALSAVAVAFEQQSGAKVELRFGPSGLLKDDIAAGQKADVFASANMAHPNALHAAERAGPVTRFARNQLCALIGSRIAVDGATLLERMLDPAVKLATSTPKADPGGDYAFEVFARAEALRKGARAALEGKALQLVGGPASAPTPPGRSPTGWHVAEGHADIFLVYCTGAAEAKQQYPALTIVALPAELAVGADYGLTVVRGAAPGGQQLADFILSPAGQEIMVRFGFSPGVER
ncbi:MAG TPA: molybdate ABC transporter substrate-binding protein [Xanthobacteraceae bacterium]|nr:molybdate ABC transporter substrate-binding protein [Xanthobacteraceae bacterium]